MTESRPLDERPNIAVVVLDTLRKDAFDKHFDWLPGRRFENAWTPSHWTVPVHGSLFTGKYASETGVHAKSPNFDYPGDTFVERLSKEGYSTRAYSSNVNITPQQNFDRGFDEFTGCWRLDTIGEEYFGWGQFADESERNGFSMYVAGVISCILSDAKTLPSLKNGFITKLRDLDLNGALIDDGAKRAKRWVSGTDFGDQEFLFMNLMEAHSPHLPPRKYRTTGRVDIDSIRGYVDGPNVPGETARQAYDDSVAYLSDVYREIYQELQKSFDYIITVSDHGEMLGEHGAWDHLYGLYPELIHVPLVVDGPECTGTTSRTASVIEIHPTVLELAGIGKDVDDTSLFDEDAARSYLTEYHGLSPTVRDSLERDGYTTGPFEKELHGIVAGGGEYGYETGSEFKTVSESSERRERLREQLDTLVRNLDRRQTEETGTSEELQSQLEALGYA